MVKKKYKKFIKLINEEREKLIDKLKYLRESTMDTAVKDASGDHSSSGLTKPLNVLKTTPSEFAPNATMKLTKNVLKRFLLQQCASIVKQNSKL